MRRLWAVLFSVIMLLTAGWLTFFCIRQNHMDELLSETALSLETSRGRERKQNAEYNDVVQQLPQTQLQLDELSPAAAASSAELAALKAQRKALRADISTLSAELETLSTEEASLYARLRAQMTRLLTADAARIAAALAEVLP